MSRKIYRTLDVGIPDDRRYIILETPWGDGSGMIPPPLITFWTSDRGEVVYQHTGLDDDAT